jgi:ABC-type branched-subunit amino acid transport system substrate-binding protein
VIPSTASNGAEVEALLARYQRALEDWDESQDRPTEANALFDAAHALAKQLRQTKEGRAGIQALLDHPRAGVQLLAASDTLAWAPDRAITILESLETGPGLYAVSAKYTLRSYRSGTLNLDW